MLLEGIYAAVTTPFYPDERLYLRKLEHNIARYGHTPLSGLVVLGSTGEAVHLCTEEQCEVLATAIAAAPPDKGMIAGVGQESVHATLHLAEHAARLQYDAVLVRTPHFYRTQLHRAGGAPLEMLTYFRTVADRSPLPVLLYSVPDFTHYDLPVAIVAELAHHPNIIGIKDSSGNAERIDALVAATRFRKRTVTVTPVFAAVTARMAAQPQQGTGSQSFLAAETLSHSGAALAVAPPAPAIKTRQKETGFAVLSGAAQSLLPTLQAGASGAVLAFAACAPQCCHEVYAAWKEGDAPLAEEKQQRLAQAAARIGSQLGIPGIKFACDWNGYYGGRPRLPLLPLSADEQTQVQSLLADLRY
jgi:4-hydroxy-2-oxoglutarate aldolase